MNDDKFEIYSRMAGSQLISFTMCISITLACLMNTQDIIQKHCILVALLGIPWDLYKYKFFVKIVQLLFST